MVFTLRPTRPTWIFPVTELDPRLALVTSMGLTPKVTPHQLTHLHPSTSTGPPGAVTPRGPGALLRRRRRLPWRHLQRRRRRGRHALHRAAGAAVLGGVTVEPGGLLHQEMP